MQKAMPITLKDRVLSKKMAGIQTGKERIEGKTWWEDIGRKSQSSVVQALAKTQWLPARRKPTSGRLLNLTFISLLSVGTDAINGFKTKSGSNFKSSNNTFFILSVNSECQRRARSECLCALNCVSDSMSREAMW